MENEQINITINLASKKQWRQNGTREIELEK